MKQFGLPKVSAVIGGLVATLLGCVVTAEVATSAPSTDRGPRNIILLIGDGMGPQQIALSELYWRRTGDEKARPLHEFLSRVTNGMHIPLPEHSLVNDSACAASQLAGGCQCEPRQVGMDVHGAQCKSVVRSAKKKGLRVGVVSDTRITHATPAAFYGYVGDRDEEPQLARQLVESDLDLALSGGAELFLPAKEQGKKSAGAHTTSCEQREWGKRSDGLNVLRDMQARGRQIVCSAPELDRVRALPVVGLFSPGHMANAFREGEGTEPTLARMTERALQLLDNPSGFFLMVEAGQIDTAGHHNDAGWVLAEMLRLSSVLRVVEQFVEKHPDTLVVLTADHETGGMGFSYRSRGTTAAGSSTSRHGIDFLSKSHLASLASQTATIADIFERYQRAHASVGDLQALQKALSKDTGTTLSLSELAVIVGRHDSGVTDTLSREKGIHFTRNFYPYANYSPVVSIARRLSAEQGVVWATGTHTTTPVNVLAIGPGAQQFQGWFSSKEIGIKLLQLVH